MATTATLSSHSHIHPHAHTHSLSQATSTASAAAAAVVAAAAAANISTASAAATTTTTSNNNNNINSDPIAGLGFKHRYIPPTDYLPILPNSFFTSLPKSKSGTLAPVFLNAQAQQSVRREHNFSRGYTTPQKPTFTTYHHPGPSAVSRYRSVLSERPHSIDELAEIAKHTLLPDAEFDDDLILALEFSEVYLREAILDHELGDVEMAFVNYARTVTMVSNKIPFHPRFMKLKESHRVKCSARGDKCLAQMDLLKPLIVERYESWRLENPHYPLPPLAHSALPATLDLQRIKNIMQRRDDEGYDEREESYEVKMRKQRAQRLIMQKRRERRSAVSAALGNLGLGLGYSGGGGSGSVSSPSPPKNTEKAKEVKPSPKKYLSQSQEYPPHHHSPQHAQVQASQQTQTYKASPSHSSYSTSRTATTSGSGHSRSQSEDYQTQLRDREREQRLQEEVARHRLELEKQEARKREEAETRKREAEAAARRKADEEMARRRAEEEKEVIAAAAAERRENERRAEEMRRMEETRRRQDELARKRAEEEAAAAAAARRKAEEERREQERRMEEARRMEETRKLEETRRKSEEEAARRRAAAEEERRRKEEERKLKEAAEEERRRKDEERLLEGARRRQQEEAEARRRAEEAAAAAEAKRKAEEEAELLRKQERQQEILRRRAEEIQEAKRRETLREQEANAAYREREARGEVQLPSFSKSASGSGFAAHRASHSQSQSQSQSAPPPQSQSQPVPPLQSQSQPYSRSSPSYASEVTPSVKQEGLPVLPLESPTKIVPTDSNHVHLNSQPKQPMPQVAAVSRSGGSGKAHAHFAPITTTSPPPKERPGHGYHGYCSFPTLHNTMSEHQRQQGYTPSLQSMFSSPLPTPSTGLLFAANHPEGPSTKNIPQSPDRPPAHVRHLWAMQSGEEMPARRPSPTSRIILTDQLRKDEMDSLLGPELRIVRVPLLVIDRFLTVAAVNTAKRRETCGMLMGRYETRFNGVESKGFVVTTLLIPRQSGTGDSCTMLDEELVADFAEKRKLIALGWIHTHPTQSCFMSSLDLHTHAAFQATLREFFAIVCSPPHYVPNCGVFRLTEIGLSTIRNCRERAAFHPHPENVPMYTDADKGHVLWINDSRLEIIDLR